MPAINRRSPIVPQSKSNPTNSDRMLKKAYAKLTASADTMQAIVVQLVIAAKDNTSAGPFLNFAITDEQQIEDELQKKQKEDDKLKELLSLLLLLGRSPSSLRILGFKLNDFFISSLVDGTDYNNFALSDEIDQAYNLGIAQANANLSQLSPEYEQARPLNAATTDAEQTQQKDLIKYSAFIALVSFATAAAAKVMQVLTEPTLTKEGAMAAVTSIFNRLTSDSQRQAQKNITAAVRTARQMEKTKAEKITGQRFGLLWASALMPTTRPWHASRHGLVYTAQEVVDFYSVDGNQYNCHCAVVECLIDENGKPVIADSKLSKMQKAKKEWQSANIKKG